MVAAKPTRRRVEVASNRENEGKRGEMSQCFDETFPRAAECGVVNEGKFLQSKSEGKSG